MTALAEGMGNLPQAVISADTARQLGLAIPPSAASTRYLIRLGHDVTDADLAKAGDIAGAYPDTWADAAIPPRLAGEGFRWLMIGASLLLALSVTGIAVALGEAESRPEQRTLLALGAQPGLRRWVAAARAGSIALLAGVLAVPAGLLPVWGLVRQPQRTTGGARPRGAGGGGRVAGARGPWDVAPQPADPQLVRLPRPGTMSRGE